MPGRRGAIHSVPATANRQPSTADLWRPLPTAGRRNRGAARGRCACPGEPYGPLRSRGMSNRHLALAAAIVWAIAVLVGAFIAAPLWFGFDVDVGLIVNALGALAAAAAAVWVATSDRRERTRERHDAEEAEAKLVLIQVFAKEDPSFLVLVRNFGAVSILDVELVKFEIVDHPWPKLSKTPVQYAVVPANREIVFMKTSGDPNAVYGRTFTLEPEDKRTRESMRPRNADGIFTETTKLRLTIRD